MSEGLECWMANQWTQVQIPLSKTISGIVNTVYTDKVSFSKGLSVTWWMSG